MRLVPLASKLHVHSRGRSYVRHTQTMWRATPTRLRDCGAAPVTHLSVLLLLRSTKARFVHGWWLVRTIIARATYVHAPHFHMHTRLHVLQRPDAHRLHGSRNTSRRQGHHGVRALLGHGCCCCFWLSSEKNADMQHAIRNIGEVRVWHARWRWAAGSSPQWLPMMKQVDDYAVEGVLQASHLRR